MLSCFARSTYNTHTYSSSQQTTELCTAWNHKHNTETTIFLTGSYNIAHFGRCHIVHFLSTMWIRKHILLPEVLDLLLPTDAVLLLSITKRQNCLFCTSPESQQATAKLPVLTYSSTNTRYNFWLVITVVLSYDNWEHLTFVPQHQNILTTAITNVLFHIRSTVLRPSIVNPCFITLAVASHNSSRL